MLFLKRKTAGAYQSVAGKQREQMDEGCLRQALNLSNLPFVHKWVALMPDTHEGYGMPIGGVIAVEGAIIPNAVGVDIGCGVAFVETNKHKSELTPGEYKNLVGQIMRDIPTGFKHHAKRQRCETLEQSEFAKAMERKNAGRPAADRGGVLPGWHAGRRQSLY